MSFQTECRTLRRTIIVAKHHARVSLRLVAVLDTNAGRIGDVRPRILVQDKRAQVREGYKLFSSVVNNSAVICGTLLTTRNAIVVGAIEEPVF